MKYSEKNSSSSLTIGKKTFFTSVFILLLLMLIAGILTAVVPSGSYSRAVTQGREVIVPGSFHYTEKAAYPIWRWITAPVEVLWGPDAAMVIVITLFILTISGAFCLLENSGVLGVMIGRIVNRYESKKYVLMCMITLFFMMLGAILGTFEENIVLVPIIIALAKVLGWDSLVGLGMSILASCFGFAAAITNPFSISITQKIADLPLYSGAWFRIIIFIVIYVILCVFLVRYAKKIEKNPAASLVYEEETAAYHTEQETPKKQADKAKFSLETSPAMNRAFICFVIFMGLIVAVMLLTAVFKSLSDVVLPLIGLLFLVGSLVSSFYAGYRLKEMLPVLLKGISGMAPGIVLILMAMSVKHIISNGGIMDTILYHAADAISRTSPYGAIYLLYVLILGLELFVASSSAKAFLLMPLVSPLADLVGITRQTAVVAFSFGDGFSNVLYPTNPVLLICLGLTIVSYPKWFKWTIKLQLTVFAVTCAFLAIAVAIKLGPF
jgi:uncharacterized ion transporter superfamily protein YfcC